ncbi:hypothetical protein [Psychrobacter sp. I-STPA6b]|uniref:hypothetical protein n=1 Tax=Psychrobacter sp. I-STPA6b TaxID=2585718 RepID=UPI001D0CD29D|nr:hypothetical protein [Psychrobacter sp. I-STPA6b]
MIIILPAEPFLIHFELLEKTRLDKTQNIYKFSLTFTHYDNEKITFALPENYQTHFHSSDLLRLINFLSDKIEKLIQYSHTTEDIELNKNSFVNSEYDIEIIADTGAYHPIEKLGILDLIFFFNINVAYHHQGASMIGLRARVDTEEIENFLNSLNKLL